MLGFYEHHRDHMDRAAAWHARDNHCTPHFHNSVELLYALSGELIATLDGEAYRVAGGTLLICSSYAVHSYATPTSSEAVIALIPIAQLPSARKLLSAQSFLSPLCPDDAQGTLGRLMCMMADASSANPLTLKGLCYTLLGLLIDRVGLGEAHPSSRAAFIRDVLDYLQQRHTEPLSAGQVASHFGYSRSRFAHLLNEHLGYTLGECLASIRCRHAAELLRETDMPVSDVALAVGFESLRTFYRTFKKQYEMTPQRYARA